MGLELAWWMRIHRHVLRFPVVWIEVKEIRNYGALPFPPALSNSIFVRNFIPEIQDFFWLIVVQKTSELPVIFIFHVLPPLAFLFRFPRPQTARFPSISHGPSNSPSAGSAGGFRLLTVPCTEKCSSKKFGKCYTIIIYPSGPKTIKKNVFLEKTII